MKSKPADFPFKAMQLIFGVAVLLVLAGFVIYYFIKKNEPVAAYTIGVFYDSTQQSAEDLEIYKMVIGKKVSALNEGGGLVGRSIKIKYLDDKGNPDSTYKVVAESITDISLIAYLGCWTSTKVDAVKAIVADHNVPFIGGYSVTDLAEPYPNIFTYEVGVDQFALSVYNVLKNRSKKAAFVGIENDLYCNALLQKIKALNREDPAFEIAFEKWYPRSEKIPEKALNNFVDSVKNNADFLLLSLNTEHSNLILEKIWQRNINIPVFSCFIDIPEIDQSIPGYKQAEIYDMSVFGIPSALNMRLQMLKDQYSTELKRSSKLDFQLGYAALIADAIGLIHAAAAENQEQDMRKRITKGLHAFIDGNKVYRGQLLDWLFTKDRVLARETVISWKPPYLEKPILAPVQYTRTDTAIIKTQVLYTNIDLIRLDRISDDEQSFNATFYLEINSENNISIEKLDFPNAVRNEINNKPLLVVKRVRTDSTNGREKIYNYLYKVSGNFYYTRNLKNYPFDRQQFSITLQTNNVYEPFFIQPPAQYLRDTTFASPGWDYVSNYVGFEHDIVYLPSNFIKSQTNIPLYKFNYTYVLKRAHIDFFLKVLTPLLAILVITYFSVFIPYRQFEALCALQVTSLLSAIALYFATYKPELEFATIADRIFIFTYIMITTLIGTSILNYGLHHYKKETSRFARFTRFYQYYIFPVIVIVFTIVIRLH